MYKRAGLKVRIYNFIRFKSLPFNTIEGFIPKEGEVIDLGCGTGLFLNLLRLNSNHRLLLGFDVDERKIRVAIESSRNDKNIIFQKIDINNIDFSSLNVKCITIIDVLYLLNAHRKKALLDKCFTALSVGGTLLIKDVNKSLSPKFLWTFLQEFLAIKIFRITTADGLYCENRQKYLSRLREAGFTVTKDIDLSKGYLYPHILYVCQKN